MSVLIPRTRTIGVRLSEQEYAAMEKYCVENGARSISDLARKAICSFVKKENQKNPLNQGVDGASTQVKHLQEKFEIVLAELASLKAGAKPFQPGDVRGVNATGEENCVRGSTGAMEPEKGDMKLNDN